MNPYLEDGVSAAPAPRESDLPTVLLLGDSIRQGYCETVKAALAGRAEVVYPADNCRNTQYVLTSLLGWTALCEREAVRCVHVNCGHWDAAHWNGDAEPLTCVAEYARNMARIIDQLRRFYPRAKIFAATTTPMHPANRVGVNPRSTEEIAAYNDALKAVCAEREIEVDDLFALAKPWGESLYADYCHYTKEGFEKLGLAVSEFLLQRL